MFKTFALPLQYEKLAAKIPYPQNEQMKAQIKAQQAERVSFQTDQKCLWSVFVTLKSLSTIVHINLDV